MKLIQSIYDNYPEYLAYVSSKVNGNVFAEDILSAAITNVYNAIDLGKKKPEEISTAGKIHKGYFYCCLTSAIMNYHRKEVFKVEISDCNSFKHEFDTNTRNIDLKALNKRLNEFSKLTPDNSFHVAVFKYIYYGGLKVAALSRITGVNRRRLKDSKDFMTLKVKQWLKEEEQKQALKDWATP